VHLPSSLSVQFLLSNPKSEQNISYVPEESTPGRPPGRWASPSGHSYRRHRGQRPGPWPR
jgi:hypothetical protein